MTTSKFTPANFAAIVAAATNKDAANAFVAEYNRLGRWSPKAESLFKAAFPNAYFDSNVGLNLGRSGSVLIDTDGDVYVFKCSEAVKARRSGYTYNRSRAWVIPA